MTDYRTLIEQYARAHGLPANLVEAVVIQESSGRADSFRFEKSVWGWFEQNPKRAGFIARRAASSYGLMQVLFATATDYGFGLEPEYLFLPETNLQYGCLHLKQMLQRNHGDVRLALASYNGGFGNRHGTQPQAYATSVLKHKGDVDAIHPEL